MSTDDTPPRVWWDRETPGWLLVDRGEGRSADMEVWRPTHQHGGRGLPDGAVELHSAPATSGVVAEQGKRIRDLSGLLRGMARRASRYRRKLHLAAQDAARHHAAAAPETSDPVLTEAMNRVGEYVSAHQQQGDRGVDLIDEKVFDDNRGGWSGELYASDLRAMLNALSVPEASDPTDTTCPWCDASKRLCGSLVGRKCCEHCSGDMHEGTPPGFTVASRLSAAADAANRQGAYDVERALNTVELRVLRDDRLARAVAAALSGEAAPDA